MSTDFQWLKLVKNNKLFHLFTDIDAEAFVFKHLCSENVEEFKTICEPELLELLITAANRLPANDDEITWSGPRYRTFSYLDPKLSRDETAKIEKEKAERIRNGVKVFRQFFINTLPLK